MTTVPQNGRIGEVIESSTTNFRAATYALLESPPFGALVRATTRDANVQVYGLVYDIHTGSREPGGRAIVRGRTYSGRYLYDDEIYRAHPDLSEVLQTEFAALTVGYVVHGRLLQRLPPQPPPVHYSVYPCTDAELVMFGEQLDFLRTVLLAPGVPGDEVLTAAVRSIAAARRDGPAYLVRVGRELARLFKEDYDRLTVLLHRIRP
ncbi:HAS-barrel domain-containing protein [Chloroflexus sp.]|uniref:HAS-barrel domain-containing protein n=1 Tax=Chloroflexus sp. TaxID=1904827 RepID=UPI002ACDFF05|nr:HAS-barrel domain-containing protein [Chloroflexus sp.]